MMNFEFKRPEDSPGFMLWRVTTEWQRAQRKSLNKLGLTHPQFVVLACIMWLMHQSDVLVTAQKVADLTGMDKMSASDLVATLLNKKLVRRTRHKLDKRAYVLSLTRKGEQLTLKAIPVVEGVDKQFFQQANTSLQRFAQLIQS